MKKKVLSLLLASTMVLSMAACGKDDSSGQSESGTSSNQSGTGSSSGQNESEDSNQGGTGDVDPSGGESGLGYTITEFDPDASYTQSIALTSIPGNWNMHDYEDSASGDIYTYLVDSLYNLSYNDELHPKEGAENWESYIFLPGMAADYPTDVTAEVKAAHPDWIPESATAGYAWEIPLREDLYFDTGYHITAETYVQSVKYLLDQRLQNYRATDFYDGAYGIVGAEAYFKQGQINYIDNGSAGNPMESFVKGEDGVYTFEGSPVYVAVDYGIAQTGGNTLKQYVEAYGDGYFGLDRWDELVALMDDKGLAPLNDDTLAMITDVTTTNPNWNETDGLSVPNYFVIAETMPDGVSFEDTVGFYAKDDYTLVQVFNGSFDGFYLYSYAIKDANILVEPDVYESCLKQDESGAWYSTYMTSKETSPSYGAYSMTGYQTDKQITFAKNDKWFGWTEDLYHVYKDPNDGNVYRGNMTTNIDMQYVPEIATRRQMFLAGQITSFGLEESDYEQYGHSDYAWSYPSETAAGLWVTGNMNGLEAREAAADFDTATQDTQTIGLVSFHKALAVSFDRQAFCDECHPAYTPGYGILGDQFIYDVEDGLFYRDTDQAKQALCDFYSVDVSQFGGGLDAAVDSITGYDLDAAKELYKAAFDESLSLGYITDADGDGICDQTITMIYASSAPADYVTRRINYLNSWIGKAVVGTPFEGKITVVESAPLGDSGWIDAYRNGSADIMIAGVGGSIYDPFNAMALYCDPNQNLTANWYDPNADMITLTINGEEITMSVYNWYQAMTGSMVTVGGKDYSFGSADVEPDVRMTILAALESRMMSRYDILPMCNFGAKSLLSQKLFNVLDDYNPLFQSYGPRRYNYSDAEWEKYVGEQIAAHGQLQY